LELFLGIEKEKGLVLYIWQHGKQKLRISTVSFFPNDESFAQLGKLLALLSANFATADWTTAF
jgi:hypothetical protein